MKVLPKELEGIELGLVSTITGYAISQFSTSNSLYGYGLSSLGIILSAITLISTRNPYKKLLTNTKLEANGEAPKFLGKRPTDYGYCLTFSLPTGMSTSDFEKKQLAIEQYLNRKIDISYDNWKVFIRVFEKELEKNIPFEIIQTKNPLEFPIGKIFGGKILTIDLEKIIHLLIAGETGSGKSTLLRGIITSLILSKQNIELYLIDLKNGAEFSVFQKSHKVRSFTRDKEDAEIILSKLIDEVDERYDLFYQNDVVDIGEYNKIKGIKKLTKKVVIIDEFADLQKEKGSISSVETLAAKARACGIHLIISTQRPSANIINGTIKANIPATIGFKTRNELNSRIIIDEGGLEKLSGKGNGIYQFTDNVEFQSMYITNEQARELIKHTYIDKKKKKPEPPKPITDFDFLKNIVGDANGSQ